MPPARKTAGRAASSCSTISPFGPSILTGVPAAADLSTRLNALSRMRVHHQLGLMRRRRERESPAAALGEMERHRAFRHWLTAREDGLVGRHSEHPDSLEAVRCLIALAGIVVPVELAGLLALRQLVRAVAIRLVLRQAAFAQPDFFPFGDVAGRLLQGALY